MVLSCLFGQFVNMVTELGKQLLFLIVMLIFCRTTWNVVKKQFGGKVLAVDVEGHVYFVNCSLKCFVV